MFQPDRAIFRELCTVKSNLKTNAVFIKYYGQCRLVKKLKCLSSRWTDTEQADDNHNKQQDQSSPQ
jgi:hypothetical protein